MTTLEEQREQAAQARYGKPWDQLIPAQKAHVTMDLGRVIEGEEAIQTTFGLERDLQQALRQNIEQLEHGLKVTDGGREQKVASGFIDITAEDRNGSIVVIELKAGRADRETVGQILGYMGDLQPRSTKPVRGIVVAKDFDAAPVSALDAVPNLQLRKYTFNFSFEAVLRVQPAMRPRADRAEDSWSPGFFENVLGSWQGEPLVREPEGDYETRETM